MDFSGWALAPAVDDEEEDPSPPSQESAAPPPPPPLAPVVNLPPQEVTITPDTPDTAVDHPPPPQESAATPPPPPPAPVVDSPPPEVTITTGKREDHPPTPQPQDTASLDGSVDNTLSHPRTVGGSHIYGGWKLKSVVNAVKKTKDYRPRLIMFYCKYAPDRANVEVDVMLKNYRGREEELFRALTKKYGAEPPPGWDPAVAKIEEEIKAKNIEMAQRKARSRARKNRKKSGVQVGDGGEEYPSDFEDGEEVEEEEEAVIVMHPVKKGDSLASIGLRYRVTAAALRTANGHQTLPDADDTVLVWKSVARVVVPMEKNAVVEAPPDDPTPIQRLGRGYHARQTYKLLPARMDMVHAERTTRSLIFQEEALHTLEWIQWLELFFRAVVDTTWEGKHAALVQRCYRGLTSCWKAPRAPVVSVTVVATCMSHGERVREGNSNMRQAQRCITKTKTTRVVLPPVEAEVRRKTVALGNNYMKQGVHAPPPVRKSLPPMAAKPTHHEVVEKGNDYMRQAKKVISHHKKEEEIVDTRPNHYALGNEYMAAAKVRALIERSIGSPRKKRTVVEEEVGPSPKRSDQMNMKLWQPKGMPQSSSPLW